VSADVPSDHLWEAHADWWIAEFTDGADPEYEEQILPLAAEHLAGARRVLDVGCGDGQVARVAAREGAGLVVGIDPTWNQVTVAAERGGGPVFARAGATALPFADATFDAVVVCLVFEHVRDIDGAVAEVARVLTAGGRFVFMVNHPLFQTPLSGWIDDQVVDPPEQYWRVGPYLNEVETVEEVEKDVFIHFVHRPLSRYVNALAAHGLVLEHLVEPAPPPGLLAKAPEYPEAATIPRLLLLRLRKAG
jgi:SAM-dependent methyltransferase